MPRRRQAEEEVEDDHDNDRTGVLGESGLTEEDRREVRKAQRQLLKDLEEDGTIEVDDARGRNNKIYKKVRYTREAVLDGENLISIAKKASQMVDRLIQVPRYDADRLVRKLVEKVRKEINGGTETQFDWEVLGEAAGACFNAVPSGICFLNGSLTHGQPPVERKIPSRRRMVQEDKDAVEERPEDVEGHTEKDDNKLSAVEKSMNDMYKALQHNVNKHYNENKRKLNEANGGEIDNAAKKKLKKYGSEIDGVKFLFNPKSFTQTVENIFHYSFLVKKGGAAIQVREKGLEIDGPVKTKPGLVLKYVKESQNENQNKKAYTPKQAIMSLNMQEWRALCAAYEVVEGDLPHRKIKKDQYAASLSQASGLRSP